MARGPGKHPIERCYPLGWLWRATFWLLPLCVALWLNSATSGGPSRVTKLYSIPLPEEHRLVLADINKEGLVLIDAVGNPGDPYPSWSRPDPRLRLYDTKQASFVSEIPLDWPKLQASIPRAHSYQRPGPFKFLRDGTRVLGVQNPWLVLIDLESRREVNRVLAAQDLLNPDAPCFKPIVRPNYTMTAVNPRDDTIAAAFNLGLEPRVFLFSPDLSKVIRSWAVSRYVQDLSWSSDGTALTVLYSGAFDENRKFVWNKPYEAPTTLPDVVIFDPGSGKEVMKFFSGGVQSRISYSPDGRLIYCISVGVHDDYQYEKDVVRVFSASSGDLTQVISVPGTGVRNNFLLSANGKLIVADASTKVRRHLLGEGPWGLKIGRFVLLDAASGSLIFEHHERMPGETFTPLRFAFSPDGRRLFVDMSEYEKGRHGERIDVYSLEDLQ